MFHSVIIATKGRSSELQDTVLSLTSQECPVDEIVVSATCDTDVKNLVRADSIKVVFGATGLPVQRNAGIRSLNPQCELVTFLDDDVELATSYCRRLRQFMEKHSHVNGAGGRVIVNEQITREEARKTLSDQIAVFPEATAHTTQSLYGCNMSFRRSAISNEWFDERLSLYAWLEDFDFSVRIGRKGCLSIVPDLLLCHLCSPLGRIGQERFGFAQIMNPYYLAKKGTLDRHDLWKNNILKALAANVVRLPGDTHNRSRRLVGNLRALAMVANGKIWPEAIVNI